MKISRRLAVIGGALALGGCSISRPYRGPQATRIVVLKAKRRMYLLRGDKVLKKYRIHLGFAPIGHKQVEGDGKTPEGRYYIDRRNPNSKFHRSLGISYPNPVDRARAAALGQSPGGDIFIHGQKAPQIPNEGNWTLGCISVTNREIEQIYGMVGKGTPIDIYP